MTQAAFLLFVFLKQFYIKSSGSVGIADLCMAFCVIFLVLDIVRGKRKMPSVTDLKREKFLIAFLICVVIINLFFTIKDRCLDYERYTLYWIFNGAAIWCFLELADKDFLKKLNGVCKINILTQAVIWVLGYGRVFTEYWGPTRYMGTFNDPNQYAFYLFCMILLISLYACNYGDRTAPIYYCLGVVFMSISKSTGIFLGLMLYTVGMAIWFYVRYRSKWNIPRKTEMTLGVVLILAAIAIVIKIFPGPDFNLKNTDYTMLTRIQEKIWKVLYGGNSTMLSDRGMDRVALYPRYLLLGAGEGNFNRFLKAAQQNEIHCSFLNIWFSYGVIPTVLLLKWLWEKMRKISAVEWIIAGSLIVESFLLVNYRQPFFWMILLYGYIRQKNQEKTASTLSFQQSDDIL